MISHASEIPRDLRQFVDLDWYLGTNVKATSLSPPAIVTNLLLEDSSTPATFALCLELVPIQEAKSVSQSKELIRVKNYVMRQGEFLWRVSDDDSDVKKMVWFSFKKLNLQKATDFPPMKPFDTLFDPDFSKEVKCSVLGQTLWKLEGSGSCMTVHFSSGVTFKTYSDRLVVSEITQKITPDANSDEKIVDCGTMSVRNGIKHFEIFHKDDADDLNEIESD